MQSPKITIVEVGPRDGLQMESPVPTHIKVSLINQIARSGIRKIEATSFVHPKVIPQMRDASEVMSLINRVPGTCYVGLVPNLRGTQDAIKSRVDAVKVVICVTESSNQKNIKMSKAESIRQSEDIFKLADQSGVSAEAVASVAFGCPYEGNVTDAAVINLVESFVTIGYREISIADTIGVANPASVRHISSILRKQFPQAHFSLHFHNTRGLGLANVLAGMDVGIDQFDTSIGGLGGCPIVKGGTGNVATEDLVNMLDEMEVPCGVSLDSILEAARMAQNALDHPLSSYVLTSGSPASLYRSNLISGAENLPEQT